MLSLSLASLVSKPLFWPSRCYVTDAKVPKYHHSTYKCPDLFTEASIAAISRSLKGMSRLVLNRPRFPSSNASDPVKRAAVLVPLVNYAPKTTSTPVTEGRSRASIIYTLRASTLRNYGGQVAFPGGVMDPEDEGDFVKTALRETWEEIGIESKHIQPIGLFHDVTSMNGILVTPVVAYIPNWQSIAYHHAQKNEDEVEEIFEVPLCHLIDPTKFQLDHLKRGPLPRYIVDPYRREKDIWGMTAYITDWLLRTVLEDR